MSGTDWPTIRPYCGTGGGKRPDARGHALVTHRQGSVSEGARRSEEELLHRALFVSRISADTSILTLVSSAAMQLYCYSSVFGPH